MKIIFTATFLLLALTLVSQVKHELELPLLTQNTNTFFHTKRQIEENSSIIDRLKNVKMNFDYAAKYKGVKLGIGRYAYSNMSKDVEVNYSPRYIDYNAIYLKLGSYYKSHNLEVDGSLLYNVFASGSISGHYPENMIICIVYLMSQKTNNFGIEAGLRYYFLPRFYIKYNMQYIPNAYKYMSKNEVINVTHMALKVGLHI